MADVDKENPLLECATWHFLLQQPHTPPAERKEVTEKLRKFIKDNDMAPFYLKLSESFDWPVDAALLAKMEKANAEAIKKADEKIEDVKENSGETEVRDAILEKAHYYAKIANKEKALEVFEDALEKSVGSNSKLEVSFEILLQAFFWLDYKLMKSEIERAKALVAAGGDWERRNRLKVYEATYFMVTRDLEAAANLFIDAVATFAASELYSFDQFVFYAVLTAMISLDRVQLREKVVESPEILSAIENTPHLNSFLQSVFKCQYEDFFGSLSGIMHLVQRDRYLASHASHYLRSIRVVTYSQFLESYQSVQMSTMAEKFGVSEEFIDGDLSPFIASGRLNAKIDKVGGVIETNRPDAKNKQYSSVLEQGDLLLNHIQKLSRMVMH